MDKIKALLAVALFIATILFASYEEDHPKRLSVKNNTNHQAGIQSKADTLVLH